MRITLVIIVTIMTMIVTIVARDKIQYWWGRLTIGFSSISNIQLHKPEQWRLGSNLHISRTWLSVYHYFDDDVILDAAKSSGNTKEVTSLLTISSVSWWLEIQPFQSRNENKTPKMNAPTSLVGNLVVLDDRCQLKSNVSDCH